MILKPQKGPQENFLATPADIAIYGGAAGGGKSYALLIEAVRHINNPQYGAVIFRRESKQITSEGGLWDTAQDIYPGLGAKFVASPVHTAKFNPGSKVSFSHLQHDKHVHQWDGSQIVLVGWDELQHFTSRQFWYMLSRNRSTCGIRPYVRGTCNPDPDCFLLDLLSWWIYQTEDDIPAELRATGTIPGDPNLERSGVVRYFVRMDGQVHWADTPDELIRQFGGTARPKSFTFIASNLDDNPALKEADPDYEANIEALLDYEKKRLKGNWFARPTAGELFRRTYFELVDDYEEADILNVIRYWDRAATEPSEENEDPDWTVGLKMAEMVDGSFLVIDIARDRLDPSDVEDLIDTCVDMDGEECIIGLEQEPGASGKMEVAHYERKYDDRHDVHIANKTKSKLTCWKPVARASKKGKIKVLRAGWNQNFFAELESVTDGSQPGHDDQADSFAGAFSYLTGDDFGMADGADVT